MKNPYASAAVTLANGDPVTELRSGGQRLLSESTGEFNAYDKAQLIHAITQAMQSVSSGQVVQKREVPKISAQEKNDILAHALSSDANWQSLAADMAIRIEEQRNREGLLRLLALPHNVVQGQLPRINVQIWDAVSVIATGPTSVDYQMIRNKAFFPNEFEIITSVGAERLEIEQIGGDILDRLYNQAVDATMVAEDRVLKRSLDAAVGQKNPIQYISGQLTPQSLASVRQGVTDWNLPAQTCVMSNSYWTDIIGNNDFASFLDPVTKYDLAFNGVLGTLVGMALITDGFKQPNQKVLEPGDLYVVTTPEHLAGYSDRGGIRSEPANGINNGATWRGWNLSEALAFVLANPRGVSKGKKIG